MTIMKRISISIAVLCITFAASLPAEEQEGFIKRLFRRRGAAPETAARPAQEKADAAAVSDGIEKTAAPEETAAPGAEIPGAEIAGTGMKDEDKAPVEEKTKEELVEHINDTLNYEDGILEAIPELKKEEDGFYTYDGVRLEDLDREKLDALFARIQNELNRVRIERLHQQLESVRQAQQSVRAAVQHVHQANIVAQRERQFQQDYTAMLRSQEVNIAVQRAAKVHADLVAQPRQPQFPQPHPIPPPVPAAQQQSQTPQNQPQPPKQPQPPAPPRR